MYQLYYERLAQAGLILFGLFLDEIFKFFEKIFK
jgi:hypothetical protein